MPFCYNRTMKLRKYVDGDCDAVSLLFYQTVRTVNARDYCTEQLAAWVSNADALKSRRDDLSAQHTVIAEIGGKIVGFGSMDKTGCLDLLYVHKDYQGRGIATALCNELEKDFTVIKTYASVTAKPFFEKRGYSVIKEQEVERSGIKLKNYEMVKFRV